MFGRFVAVAVALGNEPVLLLEALGPFGHDGDALPHPLAQALPPLIGDDPNNTDGEAVGWGAVGVTHSQARDDPDVAWTDQAHLSRLAKQELCLVVGTVGQQNLGVQLKRERDEEWRQNTRPWMRFYKVLLLLCRVDVARRGETMMSWYLLQQTLGLHLTGPDRHFKRQDILYIPQEV